MLPILSASAAPAYSPDFKGKARLQDGLAASHQVNGGGAGDVSLYDDFLTKLSDDPASRWPTEKEAVRSHRCRLAEKKG
jgi:hypothetical protein